MVFKVIRRLSTGVTADNNRGVASEERIAYYRARAEQGLPLFNDGPPDLGELQQIQHRAKWSR